jgi:hypothetical protein
MFQALGNTVQKIWSGSSASRSSNASSSNNTVLRRTHGGGYPEDMQPNESIRRRSNPPSLAVHSTSSSSASRGHGRARRARARHAREPGPQRSHTASSSAAPATRPATPPVTRGAVPPPPRVGHAAKRHRLDEARALPGAGPRMGAQGGGSTDLALAIARTHESNDRLLRDPRPPKRKKVADARAVVDVDALEEQKVGSGGDKVGAASHVGLGTPKGGGDGNAASGKAGGEAGSSSSTAVPPRDIAWLDSNGNRTRSQRHAYPAPPRPSSAPSLPSSIPPTRSVKQSNSPAVHAPSPLRHTVASSLPPTASTHGSGGEASPPRVPRIRPPAVPRPATAPSASSPRGRESAGSFDQKSSQRLEAPTPSRQSDALAATQPSDHASGANVRSDPSGAPSEILADTAAETDHPDKLVQAAVDFLQKCEPFLYTKGVYGPKNNADRYLTTFDADRAALARAYAYNATFSYRIHSPWGGQDPSGTPDNRMSFSARADTTDVADLGGCGTVRRGRGYGQKEAVEALLALGPRRFVSHSAGARVRYDVVPTPEGVLMVCHCTAVHPDALSEQVAVEQTFVLRSVEEGNEGEHVGVLDT